MLHGKLVGCWFIMLSQLGSRHLGACITRLFEALNGLVVDESQLNKHFQKNLEQTFSQCVSKFGKFLFKT
jgi:hypothetical protein